MATAKKEVAKKEVANIDSAGGALVLNDRPDWLDPNSYRGSEDVTSKDIILPRIDVLQALSPQIKKSDAQYIEGAEQGMIFNTVSGELYGDQLVFIPVMFKREFIVWQDRKAGGGFRGAFQTAEEAEHERQMLENPDGHEVVETHVHFVLLVHDDGRLEEAVLSLSKSKRKVSRKLNSLVQMVPGDRFSRVYKLTAIEVDGPKGEYWSFDVTSLGYAAKPAWERGQQTYEAITRGERGIDRNSTIDDDAVGDATV